MSKKSEKTKSDSNKKNKHIIFGALLAVALLALAAGLVLFIPSKNFTVAFYKVGDRQRQGITQVIEKIAAEKGISVVFNQYDSEKSLNSQLYLSKKPNLIFTPSGFAVQDAIENSSKKAALSADFTQGFTSSIRSALLTKDEKITAIPVLSSHFESDIETQEFRNSSVKQINTWTDVEKFMREQKRKKESPMIFAGGDPEFFLTFIGAFAESIDGISAYTDAVKIFADNAKSFNPVKIAVQLCDEPNSPLANSVKLLKSWYGQGLIHRGAFSLKMNDVEAFASSRLSSVSFMSLEAHRDFAQSTISRFTSIYFPSEYGANSRVFTGNIYYAVPMKTSKATEGMLSSLLSTEYQEALSRSTGIAPVLAQCRTPDKQADDARYWIAATTAPLPGLANEIFLTAEQKKQLSAEIASRIKN
ncbi:MAG: hypothetical protein IJ630_06210 [Treponema sp.]|nr:hypothetical protein [Treponema sp.]